MKESTSGVLGLLVLVALGDWLGVKHCSDRAG